MPQPHCRRPFSGTDRESQGHRSCFRRRQRRPRTTAKPSCRRRCAEAEGVDISSLRSQPLTSALIDRATHIFAMTGAHLETIHMLFPNGVEKSFLLREFEEPGTTVWRDVPDPIGMSRELT